MNTLDKQALLDGTAMVQTKIVVLPNDDTEQELILTEEDAVKSWVYNDLRYVPDEGFIGQFIARTLDGEFQNITDDFTIENHRIKLYIGVKRYVENPYDIICENGNILITEDYYTIGTEEENGDYVTTYYCYGTFIIEQPEDNEVADNTKFLSSDLTMLFNNYFDGNYTDENFPLSFNNIVGTGEEEEENEVARAANVPTSVTALWLAEYCCAQAGVELATKNFRNKDFEITTNQYQAGDAIRDVMRDIGKLAYTWVRIGWDDKVYLDFNVKAENTVDQYDVITNDNYYNLNTQNERYTPINRVVVGLSAVDGDFRDIKDDDSIIQNGEHALYVYDNFLTYTSELRNNALPAGSSMYGLNYDILDVETTGHPWLVGNELIKVVDMEGNNLYTYPFDKTLTYTGHIKSKIASYSNTEIQDIYNYNGNNSYIGEIRNASLKVDRANSRIEALTTKVTSDISEINGRFGDYVPTSQFSDYKQEVKTWQDERGMYIDVTKSITDNGYIEEYTDAQGKKQYRVGKLETTKGFAFDDDGMTIQETGAPTASRTDTDGIHVIDKTGSSETDLLFAGYDKYLQKTIVRTQNLNVETYLTVGSHSRFEDYEDGTGVFYID